MFFSDAKYFELNSAIYGWKKMCLILGFILRIILWGCILPYLTAVRLKKKKERKVHISSSIVDFLLLLHKSYIKEMVASV